jgi:hypothetical protein
VPSAEGGCNPEDIVRAVRKLNLMASYRWNQSAEHIREYLRRGFCVGVNYYDPDLGDEHYASIVAINGKKILLGDPIVGGVREMNLQTFIDNWRETSLYPRKRLLREREAILIWE